jgi:hypothetical protein
MNNVNMTDKGETTRVDAQYDGTTILTVIPKTDQSAGPSTGQFAPIGLGSAKASGAGVRTDS